MANHPIRKVVLLTVIAAAVAAVVKALRGEPAPQFSTDHPTINGGPGAAPDPTPTPADPPAPAPAAAATIAELEAPEPPAGELDAPEPPAGELEAPDPEPELPAVTSGWAEPVDGACPPGYPIKAKLSSGIFHQPGGFSYDRTVPDRCYATAAEAEADGLRAAKR